MSFTLIIADCDGDYIPNNRPDIFTKCDWIQIEKHICKSIQNFLNQNCLLNPNSGELQITDFMWDDPYQIDVPKFVASEEEFMTKVHEIVKSMETAKRTKKFKFHTDDDNCIEFKWDYASLRISYNMAPNRNSWSHIDFIIRALEE